MGKTSKASYPQYSGGSIVVNGRTVASSSKNGNDLVTNYQMSDYEKKMYNALEENMSNSLSNLFEISNQEKKAWNEQLEALKTQGVKNINDIYTPLQNNLKNDIASRFGNLDNSVFMDKLNSLTDKKSDAIAALSGSLAATQQDLYTNELNNRMNTISFLNNLYSEMNSNILNYTNAAARNSSSANSFNNQAYNSTANTNSNFLSGMNNLLNGSNYNSMLSLAKLFY